MDEQLTSWRLLGIGFFVFGVIGIYLGWRLMAEYRREFFRDPQRTMSLEVFFNLVGFGGYGYFAALALIFGVASTGLGLFVLTWPW
jgi:Ca2+/Na+ antiporter